MLSILFTALSTSALLVSGAPILEKRIAQVIAQATADWEQACLRAGGGQACNPLSVSSMATLLAAPPPCAQQDAADSMIDLARKLGNDAEMIRLAQLFRQQPRNAPDSVSSLYCQQPPRNNELQGLFQCQFQGVNDNVFTGGVALGAPGTIPLGLSSLSPPGSCPANPGGKIPDGQQLNKIVNNPGRGNGGGNNGAAQPSQPAPPAQSK
ncbi:hypothetical protein PIIN_01379 [Serendipita indica DSM 11827]|uniref:Uncharacterized protein n=1 Tax=Serendipita indica (strain DSM 11827) TaxID=1109443 RepID=G4T8A7_SERID|nr:hypothetical protein PIIN_01379 [Serendipita indica DSM 11827]